MSVRRYLTYNTPVKMHALLICMGCLCANARRAISAYDSIPIDRTLSSKSNGTVSDLVYRLGAPANASEYEVRAIIARNEKEAESRGAPSLL